MARLRAGGAPVYYGDDRAAVHIGTVVWRGSRVWSRPVLGFCQTERPPVGTLRLAYGVSVTCPDCLAEANRRTTMKESRRA